MKKNRQKHAKETCRGTRKNLHCTPHPPISLGEAKEKVLRCVNEGGNPSSIARRLNRARATIQEHLRDLEQRDLVYKENSLWFLTDVGKEFLGCRFGLVGYEREGAGITTEWLQDRAHNIKIKVDVVEKPDKGSWLRSWEKNDKLKNNIFYTKRFGEIVTTYTGRSVIFQLPILRFKSSEMAMAEAGRIVQSLVNKYENDVEGLKLGNHSIKAQVISQHHAIQSDPYAIFLHKHGISYNGENVDVDASSCCSNCGKPVPEIEFTNSEEGHSHYERYVEMVEDYIGNELPKPSEMVRSIVMLQSQLKEVVEAQQVTNMQLQTLVMAINGASGKAKNNKEQDEKPAYFG